MIRVILWPFRALRFVFLLLLFAGLHGILFRAIVGQYRSDRWIWGKEEADRQWARKALIEQTHQAGDAMTTKDAEEVRVWLNDRGISDSDIIEYDMNDLLAEARSGEAENDNNSDDD